MPTRAVFAILLCLLPSISWATWSSNIYEPVVVADDAVADELLFDAVPDGRGGIISIWTEPGTSTVVRAQRVDALGRRVWDPAGIVLLDEVPSGSGTLDVVSGGEGGLLYAWTEVSTRGDLDIRAQRIGADGSELWAAGGVGVCTTSDEQVQPTIIGDGAGGAFVAWFGIAGGGFRPGVFVQKLDPSGNAQLTADGERLGSTSIVTLDPIQALTTDDGDVRLFWLDGDQVFYELLDANGTIVFGSVRNLTALASTAIGGSGRWQVVGDGSPNFWVVNEDDANGGELTSSFVANDQFAFALFPVPLTDVTGWLTVTDGTGGIITARSTENGAFKSIRADRYSLASGTQWTDVGIDGGLDFDFGTWSIAPDNAGGVWWIGRLTNTFVDGALSIERILANGTRGYGDAMGPVSAGFNAGAAPAPVAVADLENGLLVAFDQANGLGIRAMRGDRHGGFGHPRAIVTDVADVPGDEGGAVLVSWDASALDVFPEQEIVDYSVWRRSLAVGASSAMARSLDVATDELRALGFEPEAVSALTGAGWEPVGSVGAAYQQRYALSTPTYADSTVLGPSPMEVKVIARTNDPFVFWESNVLSGQSTDDLAPDAPQNFDVTYDATSTQLGWTTSTAPDLAFYRVFRGTSPTFEANTASIVAEVTHLKWTDAAGGVGAFYKIVAVDDALNQSEVVAQDLATDAPAGRERAVVLQTNIPNPFNPSTTIRYSLPQAAQVSVDVYDLAGRRVRTLHSGPMPAGDHAVAWNGLDDQGRGAASGTYLVRLRADADLRTQKIQMLK